MTQQNGNDQKQRQLAPGAGGQEQVQKPDQKDQQGQKNDQAQEAQRDQDGPLEQGPKDAKKQPDDGSSSEQS